MWGEECQLKEHIKAKSHELTVVEKEVDVNSKVLTDLEAMLILSLDDIGSWRGLSRSC